MKAIYFLNNAKQTFTIELNKQSPQYWYSQTYAAPWLNTPENGLGTYLWDEGSMRLTSTKLYIKLKNNKFVIEKPKTASIRHVKLYAPILAGGIFAPFALIATSQNMISLWVSVSIALVGMALFYYGYKGVYSIEIQGESKSKRFFIDEKTQELENFLEKIKTNFATRFFASN